MTGQGVERRLIESLSSSQISRVNIDAAALVRGQRCPLSARES